MNRKLFLLAFVLGICAFGASGHSAAAATPGRCSVAYCDAHPGEPCVCPPGTVFAGRDFGCPSTIADCNNV